MSVEITLHQKRKISKLWNALKPLQRSRVFHMKPTCLFVFHNWDELDNHQRDIVFNAVRVVIENAITRHEQKLWFIELKRLMNKYLPHVEV